MAFIHCYYDFSSIFFYFYKKILEPFSVKSCSELTNLRGCLLSFILSALTYITHVTIDRHIMLHPFPSSLVCYCNKFIAFFQKCCFPFPVHCLLVKIGTRTGVYELMILEIVFFFLYCLLFIPFYLPFSVWGGYVFCVICCNYTVNA